MNNQNIDEAYAVTRNYGIILKHKQAVIPQGTKCYIGQNVVAPTGRIGVLPLKEQSINFREVCNINK